MYSLFRCICIHHVYIYIYIYIYISISITQLSRTACARPKSVNFARIRPSSTTFSGFRSRKTTPSSCIMVCYCIASTSLHTMIRR